MCDVRIASWYPLCSHLQSQLERPKLSQGQGEDEKRCASCAASGEKNPGWAEFLVSSISLSWYSYSALILVSRIPSHYLRTRYQMQMPHPKPRPITPPNSHHLLKSKLVPSSSCPPFLALPLRLQVPHPIRPPATPMAHKENMCLAHPTSHTPQETDSITVSARYNSVDSTHGPLLLLPPRLHRSASSFMHSCPHIRDTLGQKVACHCS